MAPADVAPDDQTGEARTAGGDDEDEEECQLSKRDEEDRQLSKRDEEDRLRLTNLLAHMTVCQQPHTQCFMAAGTTQAVGLYSCRCTHSPMACLVCKAPCASACVLVEAEVLL